MKPDAPSWPGVRADAERFPPKTCRSTSTRCCARIPRRGAGWRDVPAEARSARKRDGLAPAARCDRPVAMRKPVILITGAGGEIGHGLVTRPGGVRPADRHARRRAARHGAGAARRARVHRVDHRRGPARPRCWPSSRSIWCSTSRRCCRRAPSSRRSPRTTSTSRARSTCSSSRSSKANRTAGRSCSSTPRRSPPTACRDSTTKAARRPGARGRLRASDDDVRVQQAVLRAARALLRAALQAAGGGRGARASTSGACGFPGLISAVTVPSGGTSDYAPEMIHAAARGRAVRVLRPARHDDPVHGDARRDRRAADAGGGAARAR